MQGIALEAQTPFFPPRPVFLRGASTAPQFSSGWVLLPLLPQGPPKDRVQPFRVRLCQELPCGHQPLRCPPIIPLAGTHALV